MAHSKCPLNINYYYYINWWLHTEEKELRRDDTRFWLRMLKECWHHALTPSKGWGEDVISFGWGMMSFGLVKFEVAACDDIEQIFMCSGKRLSLEVTIRANKFLWPLSHSRSTLGEHLTLSLDWTHSQNWFIQDPSLSWANQDPFLEIWDWDRDITAQSSWSLQWKRCKFNLHKGKWDRKKKKKTK